MSHAFTEMVISLTCTNWLFWNGTPKSDDISSPTATLYAVCVASLSLYIPLIFKLHMNSDQFTHRSHLPGWCP